MGKEDLDQKREIRSKGSGLAGVAAAASLALMLAAGCSPGGTTAATATSTPSGATPISAKPYTMNIYAADSLATPLGAIDTLFTQRYPQVTINLHSEGSVKVASDVTVLGMPADVAIVADYKVIPKYFMNVPTAAAQSTWYAGFASAPLVLAYTKSSKGASTINASNWYTTLEQSGVNLGYGNPDSDPGGYRFIWALELAGKIYHQPNLEKLVLANAPTKNIVASAAAAIPDVQAGQFDYAPMYEPNAVAAGLEYLDLPDGLDFTDPSKAALYATAAYTNTVTGAVSHGDPTIYAYTIPSNAPNVSWSINYLTFFDSPAAQGIFQQGNWQIIVPNYASSLTAVPTQLKPLMVAWPAS